MSFGINTSVCVGDNYACVIFGIIAFICAGLFILFIKNTAIAKAEI